jgi:hypothetical protein
MEEEGVPGLEGAGWIYDPGRYDIAIEGGAGSVQRQNGVPPLAHLELPWQSCGGGRNRLWECDIGSWLCE